MEQATLEQEIQTALKTERYAIVEQISLTYLEQFPQKAYGFYHLGMCKFKQKRFDEAKENLEKALALSPNDNKILFLLAETLLELQDRNGAGEIYEKLAQDPSVKDNAEVAIALSSFYLKAQNYETALAHANRACKIGATNPLSFLQTSYVFEYAENYKMALGAITKALSLAPKNMDIHYQYIRVCKKANRLKDTLSSYEALNELSPNNATLALEYVDTLIALEAYEKAAIQLENLLNFDAGNTAYLFLSAQLAFKLAQYEKCANICRSITTFEAQHFEAYQLGAQALENAYEYEKAIDYLSDGINAGGYLNKELLYLQRAALYTKQYNYLLALKDYQFLSQKGAYQGLGYLGVGRIYLQQDRKLEAFCALRSAQEHGAYEAIDLIETYCQTELAMEARDKENDLIQEFAEHIAANNANTLIQEIAATYWRFDKAATLKKNPDIFKELPEEMTNTIIEAFSSILVIIKPQGILILNHKDKDMRALYRIEKAEKTKLNIEATLLETQEIRKFEWIKYPNFLAIDGFAEEVSFQLIFAPSGLNDTDKITFNKRKAEGLLSYLNSNKA